MIIPYDQLSPDTLNNVLESLIMRYQENAILDTNSLSDKVQSLKQDLIAKKVFLTFDEEDETFNLVTQEALQATQEQCP